ncbi:hypothetical protein DBV15_06272 [Temnothorax longispinosus]|uniref:Uncharacterized protein n=1 Tax=Temnothorax longispinosus TaxID=300112 RepID=A0A4S2KFK9_9HYME|nr:hypothetical protein DBV15_06272 [Temnothorax longispinosus]
MSQVATMLSSGREREKESERGEPARELYLTSVHDHAFEFEFQANFAIMFIGHEGAIWWTTKLRRHPHHTLPSFHLTFFQRQRLLCPNEYITRSAQTTPKLSRRLSKGIKMRREGTEGAANLSGCDYN